MALSNRTKKWMDKKNITLKGKTVLITGANSGVGFKSAECALYLGADVIMACRNLTKAESSKEELLKDYPEASVELMKLDLSDFSSIDAFVKEIKDTKKDIDVFINNAGVFHQSGMTKDGFENVIGINYFAVYRISEEILPYLANLSHKVVYCNTVSVVHKIARIDYKDFYYSKKYGHLNVYSRSKLCLAKYSYELSQKYENTNIFVYMIHPGISVTPLGVNAFGNFVKKIAPYVGGIFNSPEKSALQTIYILSKNTPAGSLVGPGIFGVWGFPKEGRVGKSVKTGRDELIEFTKNELKRRCHD